MRAALYVAITAALMAEGTWLLGWWMVPLLAAVVAAFDRNRRASVVKATLAAPLAWGFLLLVQDLFGSSVTQFGRDVGASLGVPANVPLVLALVLPTLLAVSAAGTVAAIRRIRSQPPPPAAL